VAAEFDPSLFVILVVDDEAMNRDMLARRLERKGYFVLQASSGAEALETIRGTGCDLVLLDLNMPRMSGLECLEEVRRARPFDELPVIMTSARTDTDAITTSLELGANDYVNKPLDFAVLLARMRAQLTMKTASDRRKETEARFRMVADLSADLISLHAPDGTFRYASPASREILGCEPDSLVGTRLFDLVHPADRATLPETPADLPDGMVMVRLRRTDGREAWVELRTRAMRGTRSNAVTDVQCSIRDVSFYIDAWRGPAPRKAADTVLTPAHPDVAGSMIVHVDHEVERTPPPVRRRTGTTKPGDV
jgi:PAS domain S-box-containing protein